MNIMSYLSPNNKEDKEKYYERVKKAAECFTKCVYSNKLKEKDISLISQDSNNNKTPKEIKEYIFNFLDFKEEEALDMQYNIPLIFKTKNGYE